MSNLDNNPYFAELQKIANADLTGEEPMNPDYQEDKTEEEVQKRQTENDLDEEEKTAAEEDEGEGDEDKDKSETEEASNEKDEDSDDESDDDEKDENDDAEEKEASLRQQLEAEQEKLAQALPEFGAMAHIIRVAHDEQEDPQLRKVAADRLNTMMEGEDSYVSVLEKTAQEVFAEDEENYQSLLSDEGLHFVREVLADYNDNAPMLKQADEEGDSFVQSVRRKIGDFVDKATGVSKLKSELDQVQQELNNMDQRFMEMDMTKGQTPSDDFNKRWMELSEEAPKLSKQIKGRQLGMGGLYGGLAAGAMYGGNKLHEMRNQSPEEEQLAHNDEEGQEKVSKELNTPSGSDKLKTDMKTQNDGGINKMSQDLVRNFLKVAGAAGLIDIANNEELDSSLRKEASERFDQIGSLRSFSEMNDALVKTAQEIYSEDELHQIVSGQHNDYIFDKVAFFTDQVPGMSTDELEKTAGAESVAAKGVSGALTDAKKEITGEIKGDKEKTEGQGRQYVGDMNTSGKAGGGLVGGTEGYNVINNPQKYNVEKSASFQSAEEAQMAKQAAAETYMHADAFLNELSRRQQNQ